MKLAVSLFIILTLIGPFWLLFTGQVYLRGDWRTANRESAHLAPDPKTHPEAIIQAYSARAFNWRGLFASHNWIAVKPKNARQFKVYQIVGWRTFWGLSPLVAANDIPDRNWFNQKPRIILDIRGSKAEELAPKIMEAAKKYPFANIYYIWPGPNSNTFPAFIGRQVPELKLVLPPDAMGKDFLTGFKFFDRAPSGTGYQFSLFGAFGILIAKKEGLEINILGFVYGVSFSPFSIALPGVGAIPLSKLTNGNSASGV